MTIHDLQGALRALSQQEQDEIAGLVEIIDEEADRDTWREEQEGDHWTVSESAIRQSFLHPDEDISPPDWWAIERERSNLFNDLRGPWDDQAKQYLPGPVIRIFGHWAVRIESLWTVTLWPDNPQPGQNPLIRWDELVWDEEKIAYQEIPRLQGVSVARCRITDQEDENDWSTWEWISLGQRVWLWEALESHVGEVLQKGDDGLYRSTTRTWVRRDLIAQRSGSDRMVRQWQSLAIRNDQQKRGDMANVLEAAKHQLATAVENTPLERW